jgi:gluconolactonase
MFKNLRVVAEGLRFPEGPVALPDGDVLLVEMERQTLTRVHPDGTTTVVAQTGGSPNGAAMGPDGRVYLCNSGGYEYHEAPDGLLMAGYQPDDYSGGKIQAVDLETGEVEDLYTECDGNPLRGPNDLVFDAHGGIWFTDYGKTRPRDMDHGGVYYAKADGTLIKEVLYPLMHPNGIGLSPDGSQLIFAETQRARIYRLDIKSPGTVDSGDLGQLVPVDTSFLLGAVRSLSLFDSLAVDAEGNVLVGTLSENPGITEFDGRSGDCLHHVLEGDLYDPLVTNICFGGPDLRTAYITSSGYGRLLVCDWPRPGAPLHYLNI